MLAWLRRAYHSYHKFIMHAYQHTWHVSRVHVPMPQLTSSRVCLAPQEGELDIDISQPLSHDNFQATLARYPIGEAASAAAYQQGHCQCMFPCLSSSVHHSGLREHAQGWPLLAA